MARAFLIVLDSFGCGGAPDAADYGDQGADTLGHIAAECLAGRGDRARLRAGSLRLPNLLALGLGEAARLSTGRAPTGLPEVSPQGVFGCAIETSKGKDTPSGHWELAGAPAPEPFGYFHDSSPAFPPDLIAALIQEADLPGVLGQNHAAGVAIIEALGGESLRTGKPICYTSVDSVFQIAAHEHAFGLERLYELCRIARRLCDPLRIGRVIARPFVGSSRADFRRTSNRKDFPMPPPAGNLLDRAAEQQRACLSFGKIGDIFAHRNTGREFKGASNAEILDAVTREWPRLPEGGFAFVNLVDFDTDFGHRRDVAGYAACLEDFDRRFGDIRSMLRAGDIAVVTADHGNDPTWRGTDHTRENVPIVCCAPGLPPRCVGRRGSFADIGASLAHWLELAPTLAGDSFL